MRTLEKVEKDILDKYLKKIGAYVVKPATYGYGESGHSDRIICYRGRFCSTEVKRPGKEPTKLQWRRIEAVHKAGGVALWGTAEKIITGLKEAFPKKL